MVETGVILCITKNLSCVGWESIKFLRTECHKMNACSKELPFKPFFQYFHVFLYYIFRQSADFSLVLLSRAGFVTLDVYKIFFSPPPLCIFVFVLALIAELPQNFQNLSKQFFGKNSAKYCLFSTLLQSTRSQWNFFSLTKFISLILLKFLDVFPAFSSSYWTLIFVLFDNLLFLCRER